ncbi:hypothetical protein RhiirA5_182457 [Rhizophagus irregularis]|uniref:Uncharacterized protein n=1 Tax=Rhizophagus irregularis TaxID=588596 RepID=A0A2N0PM78_9GLOM|nr:hypothetical protein RhiirA5_182457 [Rhizophagus irregularis]
MKKCNLTPRNRKILYLTNFSGSEQVSKILLFKNKNLQNVIINAPMKSIINLKDQVLFLQLIHFANYNFSILHSIQVQTLQPVMGIYL